MGLNVLKDILKEDKEQLPKFKEFIYDNFASPDPSIKLRALELLKVTAQKENLQELINQMLKKAEEVKEAGFR